MKNVPESELFSAYLDGELTADERVRVEHLLATSPESRQLLESLKALSATVQSLPVHKLDEDLSERVLRLAERRMLSEPSAGPRGADGRTSPESGPSTLASPSDSLSPEDFRWHFSLRRLLRPRNLIFPAAAVAIALLIAVMERQGEHGPGGAQVAMAPPAAASREAEALTDADKTPAEQPTIGPMKSKIRSESANLAAIDKLANRSAGQVASAERKPGAEPLSSSAANAGLSFSGPPPAAATPATPAMPGMSAAGPAADEGPAARRSNVPLAGIDMKAAEGQVPAADRKLKEATRDVVTGVAGAPALVVLCDVTNPTAARGLLEKVLNKQQVALKGNGRLQMTTEDRGKKVATDVQQLVVDISPAQLQEALGELKKHRALFTSYSLEPQVTTAAPPPASYAPFPPSPAPFPGPLGPPGPGLMRRYGPMRDDSGAAGQMLPAVSDDALELQTRSRSTTLRSARQGAQTPSDAAGAMQGRFPRGTPQTPIPSQRAQSVTSSPDMPETKSQMGLGQTIDRSLPKDQAAPAVGGGLAVKKSEAKADKASAEPDPFAKQMSGALAAQLVPAETRQQVVFMLRATAAQADRLADQEKAEPAKRAKAAAKAPTAPAKPAASPPAAAAAPK